MLLRVLSRCFDFICGNNAQRLAVCATCVLHALLVFISSKFTHTGAARWSSIEDQTRTILVPPPPCPCACPLLPLLAPSHKMHTSDRETRLDKNSTSTKRPLFFRLFFQLKPKQELHAMGQVVNRIVTGSREQSLNAQGCDPLDDFRRCIDAINNRHTANVVSS